MSVSLEDIAAGYEQKFRQRGLLAPDEVLVAGILIEDGKTYINLNAMKVKRVSTVIEQLERLSEKQLEELAKEK